MSKARLKTMWEQIQPFGRDSPNYRVPKDRPTEIRLSELHDKQSCFSEPSIAETTRSSLVSSSQLEEHASLLKSQRIDRETSHDNEDNKSQIVDHRWIDGVYLCAKASALIMLLNLALITTAAGLSRKYDNSKFPTSAVFYRGNCTLCKRWDLALHIIINVLSTCILAASNNCMQALVAPTREEINKAHAQRRWLDIGNASMRNLIAAGRCRLVLWLCLLITATPFHLLYNSMVFQSSSINDYKVVIGPHDLNSQNIQGLTTPALEQCYDFQPVGDSPGISWNETVDLIAEGNYERLTTRQCLQIPNVVNQVDYRLIVALTEVLSVSDGGDAAILWTACSMAYGADDTYFGHAKLDKDVIGRPFAMQYEITYGIDTKCVDNLAVFFNNSAVFNNSTNYQLSGCLAIKAEEHCELLYSPPICIAIVLASLVKVIAMFLSARSSRSRSVPLLTIGDAVASFIEEPDPTTKGLCWISRTEVQGGDWETSEQKGARMGTWEGGRNQPVIYKSLSRCKFWLQAPSLKRWSMALIGCLSAIAAGSYFTVESGVTLDLAYYWQSGIGSNTYNVLEQTARFSVVACVVVANMPQLIVTMSYYCYNNILTSMTLAAEYSSYGATRKPLRVTWPVKGNGSKQRSTYWLSLPYAYSIPILVIYMVLHWLVSQSLFYFRMTVYTSSGKFANALTSCVAYSPLPIFLSLLVGSLMLAILLGLSLRRFKSEMPLAGSCSAVISAACHPPRDDSNAALGLVRWGETMTSPEWMMNQLGRAEERKGHCSFTSFDTERPSLFKLYA
ncbi:uncharacterized protein N7503_000421 [Penicillium pulvis]|uniref:uncharacterized protein n=1 Tax=Penicillium pulvis TaxID=1562058 RepID=UPI002547C3B9|nr:uncharacterized protein N7503_000421 [Penicillium pulvis]KAJ5813671.1 hypothetical protein N7503_000421 [Penicillium pulvis]